LTSSHQQKEFAVVAKTTSVTNLLMDSAGIDTIRPGLSAAAWETGVINTINALTTIAPCDSSRRVLAELSAAGRTVTIVPVAAPGAAGFPRAVATPVSPQAATPAGQPFLGCNPSSAATLNQPIPALGTGTGAGSAVTVRFAGDDVIAGTASILSVSADEVLLHELVHGLRQARGQSHCEAIKSGLPSIDAASAASNNAQFYDTLEEFIAIVISNIYRSELKKQGLRRDHHGATSLQYPLTNARSFSQAWQRQMQRMLDDMQILCLDLGRLNVGYNPIREFLMTKGIL
jgi:hypothetical protein